MRYSIAILFLIIAGINAFPQDKDSIYEFITDNNKIIKLEYVENINEFIFEMRSNDKVELLVKDDLSDQISIFKVDGYHRGGGLENAAMDYNDVLFNVNDVEYDVYYSWSVDDENSDISNDPVYGLQISKDNKVIEDMKGVSVVQGDIYGWSYFDILPNVRDQ